MHDYTDRPAVTDSDRVVDRPAPDEDEDVPQSLLKYRRRPVRKAKPRPSETCEVLPGGGIVYGDVIPQPVAEEPDEDDDSLFISYDGWASFGPPRR